MTFKEGRSAAENESIASENHRDYTPADARPPVHIDEKFLHPCSATIRTCPGTNARRPHIAAKCQILVIRKPPSTATNPDN